MAVGILGLALAAAGTLYSAYSQNEAVKAANSAKPRDFVPVDINKTAQMAFAADKVGYDISDARWKSQFGPLDKGRNQIISNVQNNLAGGTSPYVTDALGKAGYGNVNLGATEAAKAQNLGLGINDIQNRDRGYFQKLLAMNPQRQAGFTGQDVARLAIANTGGQNNFNQGIFQSNLAKYNSSIQQSVANQGAAVSGLGSLAGLFSQPYQRSIYEDPNSYYNNGFGRSQQSGVSTTG